MDDLMISAKSLTTSRKALTINLDPKTYGTFAEIGAGQEVARHFFQAGAAAGTIAKSISAYDMIFSDAIYGKTSRYVSRERLSQMLDHEYQLLLERLKATRGHDTRFFAFANTVSAKSFKGTNECHGWLGIRFQMKPDEAYNDIVIHVRMLDKTNLAQQDALGIIGVNLVYGAFYYSENPDEFIISLADKLGIERIEVDQLEYNGLHLKNHDNRVIALKLVEHGMTNVAMFGPCGSVLQPSEQLYKKNILVHRGSFRPVTLVNLDMVECAGAQFLQDSRVLSEDVMVLFEITTNNLTSVENDHADIMARVDTITAMGYHVIISNYFEYYRLMSYFRRYTQKMIGVALGLNHLLEIFNEDYYHDLDGGILEACGRLFKDNVKLYIYPMKGEGVKRYLDKKQDSPSDKYSTQGIAEEFIINATNLQLKSHLRNLYAYLLERHCIEPIVGYKPECFNIFSSVVIKKLQSGDPSWEKFVPKVAANLIKKRKLWHPLEVKTTKKPIQKTSAIEKKTEKKITKKSKPK